MTLREKMIVLRDKAESSQMELAHQLGVSRQAVSRWESGTATPSMDKLKALAKIYDVSLDWLCSDTDEPYENRETAELMRVSCCTMLRGCVVLLTEKIRAEALLPG